MNIQVKKQDEDAQMEVALSHQQVVQPVVPQNIYIMPYAPKENSNRNQINEEELFLRLEREKEASAIEKIIDGQTKLIEELLKKMEEKKGNKVDSERDYIKHKISVLENQILMKKLSDEQTKKLLRMKGGKIV